MSDDRLIKNEQFVLSCFLKDHSLISNISEKENYFISDIAKDIYKSMQKLSLSKLEFSNTHILSEIENKNITYDVIQEIRNIEDIDNKNFETYYNNLKEEYGKKRFSDYILKESLVEVNKKNGFNATTISKFVNQAEDFLSLINNKDNTLLTGGQLLEEYEEDVRKRMLGNFHSSGCSHLDSIAGGGGFAPGEATLFVARSSNGKSSLMINYINKLINKRIPVLPITLEMSKFSTVDRLMCLRNNIDLNTLYPKGELENTDEADRIYDLIKKEKKKFLRNKNFMYLDQSILSLDDWYSYVKEAKRLMKTDYLIVVTDLLTMIKDFSGNNKASVYEDAMNVMHSHIKKLNVHAFNVVQASREGKEITVKKIEDLEKFKLRIQDIKNSGALYERHRKVYTLYRPFFYASQYFADKPELELIEDEVIVQCIKDSHGEVGKQIKYLFEGGNFKMLPIIEN